VRWCLFKASSLSVRRAKADARLTELSSFVASSTMRRFGDRFLSMIFVLKLEAEDQIEGVWRGIVGEDTGNS